MAAPYYCGETPPASPSGQDSGGRKTKPFELFKIDRPKLMDSSVIIAGIILVVIFLCVLASTVYFVQWLCSSSSSHHDRRTKHHHQRRGSSRDLEMGGWSQPAAQGGTTDGPRRSSRKNKKPSMSMEPPPCSAEEIELKADLSAMRAMLERDDEQQATTGGSEQQPSEYDDGFVFPFADEVAAEAKRLGALSHHTSGGGLRFEAEVYVRQKKLATRPL